MRYHIPILCDEVVENLIKKPGGIYVDCTLGFGGHSESILKNEIVFTKIHVASSLLYQSQFEYHFQLEHFPWVN